MTESEDDTTYKHWIIRALILFVIGFIYLHHTSESIDHHVWHTEAVVDHSTPSTTLPSLTPIPAQQSQHQPQLPVQSIEAITQQQPVQPITQQTPILPVTHPVHTQQSTPVPHNPQPIFLAQQAPPQPTDPAAVVSTPLITTPDPPVQLIDGVPLRPASEFKIWVPPPTPPPPSTEPVSSGLEIARTFPCYYTVPRRTSHVFITSAPNHGAGLGHQFGEWIQGMYWSTVLNISYVHTGFLRNSARWTRYLGFGDGELTIEDLQLQFDNVHTIQRTVEEHNNGPQLHAWISQQLAVAPKSQATLLNLYRIHVPDTHVSCEPSLNLLLRQKYCAARINRPVYEDLYAGDTNLIVALHLRCGDSCYNTYRATSFESVATTIRMMSEALMPQYGNKVTYHIFSQPPRNDTAENHFAPLLAHTHLQGKSIFTHFYTRSTQTLHHLIRADILVGAQSSFSWVAFLLHHGVSMGPIRSCKWAVPYEKRTGEFDMKIMLQYLEESRKHKPRFDSRADCDVLLPMEPVQPQIMF